jgi:hypothetical protein
MSRFPLARTVFSWSNSISRFQKDQISFKSRIFAMVLVVCLFSSSTPAAPRTIVDVARAATVEFKFWYPAS